MVTVKRRAAVHAALGEPVRLAIVDRLGPGDASPGELAEAVGIGQQPAGASPARCCRRPG